MNRQAGVGVAASGDGRSQVQANLGDAKGISLASNAVDFFLECKFVDAGQRQRQEQTNPALDHEKGIPIGPLQFVLNSRDCRWIGNSPMRSHGLARPHRANFLRRIVTDGEYEIEPGRVRLRKFVPALTAETFRRYPGGFKLAERFQANRSRGMASGAVGSELGRPLKLRIASAMTERAEFPVHRNRTL